MPDEFATFPSHADAGCCRAIGSQAAEDSGIRSGSPRRLDESAQRVLRSMSFTAEVFGSVHNSAGWTQ